MGKKASMRLGELLMASGVIDEWKLMLGMRSQRRNGTYIGEALVGASLVDERDLLHTLSQQLEVPYIELRARGAARMSDDTEITIGDETALECMPATVARRYGVFPLAVRSATAGLALVVATADPNNPDLLDELAWLLQMEIHPVLASRRAISEAIFRFYGDDDDPETAQMPLPELIPAFKAYRGALAIA